MKPSPSEIAIDEFEKQGPYTFKAALKVVMICEKYYEKEGIDLSDTLDAVSYKFSTEEFSKLINPEKYCTPKQYAVWKESGWTFRHILPETTDEQLLQLVSTSRTHWYIEQAMDIGRLDPIAKRIVYTAYRDALKPKSVLDLLRDELLDIKTHRKINRDASPVRK
jgi:hypothetical protein